MGFLFIGVAIVLVLTALPMMLGMVPMNRLYGARFPQSFKSDQHWDAINRHGGKALIGSSVPVLFVGIAGVVANLQSDAYTLVGLAALFVGILTAAGCSYLHARKVDRELSQ